MVVLKIFKASWFISLLAVTAVLLYGYASLPESVGVYQEGADVTRIGKDTFFYIVLAALALTNVMVFITRQIVERNVEFRTWFYGLVITFNIFFIIAISFISLYNSAEAYDYSRLQVIIYGSIVLIAVWALGWPAYLGYKKIAS